MLMRANILRSLCLGSAISSDCLDVYVCTFVSVFQVDRTSFRKTDARLSCSNQHGSQNTQAKSKY